MKTIDTIRSILAGVGLFAFESEWNRPYSNIFSVRLSTNDDLSFGSNGKGVTREYALASGYGEFIERVQNGLLAILPLDMWHSLKEKFGFYFYPDERIMTSGDFDLLGDDIKTSIFRCQAEELSSFKDLYFSRLSRNGMSGCASVPFYDVNNDDIVYLPYNLLLEVTGSNGMCAGNTFHEAVHQGLCEIIERYAGSEVFFNGLCPPRVPTEYLASFDEEYNTIREIESDGRYRVEVRDFSAGMGFPVLGVMLIDTHSHKYRLNLGCDISFKYALSRGITELYQGLKGGEDFDSTMLPIPSDEPSYFRYDNADSFKRRQEEFYQYIKDRNCQFSPRLFGDHYNYEFDPSIFSEKDSYEGEVQSLISLICRSTGSNIYIRDVSFLGFPSYYIFIPRMSRIGRNGTCIDGGRFDSEVSSVDTMEGVKSYICNFEKCSRNDLVELAALLERLSNINTMASYFMLKFKKNCEWNHFPPAYLLTLLWYKLGDYERARKHLDLFVSLGSVDERYYRIVDRYMHVKSQVSDGEGIVNALVQEGFDRELVVEVDGDLRDPSNVFQHIRFPSCPSCESCALSQECILGDSIRQIEAIYHEYRNHDVDQRETQNKLVRR